MWKEEYQEAEGEEGKGRSILHGRSSEAMGGRYSPLSLLQIKGNKEMMAFHGRQRLQRRDTSVR